MRTYLRGTLLGVVSGLLVACGDGGLPSVTPTVNITSPTDNSTVILPSNREVAVNFATNYTLKAPGTCGSLEYCGHIYVLVDSSNCNAQDKLYNNLAVSSPAIADLGKCQMATGQHTISLELRSDSGINVETLVGNPVIGKVTITAQ